MMVVLIKHNVSITTMVIMEFRLGNHMNAYASGTPVNGNTLHLNFYSHGDVMLGTHSYNFN